MKKRHLAIMRERALISMHRKREERKRWEREQVRERHLRLLLVGLSRRRRLETVEQLGNAAVTRAELGNRQLKLVQTVKTVMRQNRHDEVGEALHELLEGWRVGG